MDDARPGSNSPPAPLDTTMWALAAFPSTSSMLLLTVGLLASPLTFAPTHVGRVPDKEPAEAVAAALLETLEKGPDDEDLERVMKALEWDFDHPGVLEASARIAKELDQLDLAWWWGARAAEAADAAGDEARRDAINAFLLDITPEGADPTPVFEEYAKDLFKLAQDCKTKKLYANAADVLMRCRGTRFERRAESLLDSLFEKKGAVDAIFSSGIDLPAKPATKKDPEWIAEWDAQHAAWDAVEPIEGKGYTIRTNMGYEMAHTFASTMEQMGVFYKDLFQIRKKIKPCTIKIYATREELNQNEEHGGPNTLGWFQPWDNVVVTFDPRSIDRPFSGLWETLFHEAAHQYTRAVSSAIIPGWYSEGTACYFEGARLLPSGAVLTNQIPEGRLRNLVMLLGEERPRASLKGCISYFEPGSFDGVFYPFAWGLTYYFFNYEDEKSERIYIPLFQKYQELYTKEKAHDPVERFVDFFVTQAKVEGVTDFARFDLHWQAWIRDLHDVYFGDASKADVLLARARKQQANKKPEYAIESLRWAVDKRPADVALRMEFGKALADADQLDAATHAYRRALELARTFEGKSIPGTKGSPEDVVEECIAAITKISKNVGGGIEKSDVELIDGVRAVAASFLVAEYPRSALHVVDTAARVLGGHRDLDLLRSDLLATNDIDLRRTRRLRVPDDLAGWEATSGVEARGGDQIVAGSTGDRSRVSCSYRTEPEGPYRFEFDATLEEREDGAGIAITVGGTQTTEQILMMLAGPRVTAVLEFGEDGPEQSDLIVGSPAFDEGSTHRIRLDVDGAKLTLSVDGEELGAVELDDPDATAGRVGISVQGGRAVLGNFALTY